MKRRTFLTHSFTAAAAGAYGLHRFPHELYISEKKKFANDRVMLGNTGIEVSRLAMGTGTHGVNRSSNQTRKLGVKGLADLLYKAYDDGVFFWDSADQYGTHPHLKEALKYVPREKAVILTKTHATTEKEMKADLDRFRQEIGTDYIDVVLLHVQTRADWPEYKKAGMEVLAQAREDGIVRAHGVSCHTLVALEAAANSDWVQVDLARFNPAGVAMDDEVKVVEKVLRKMKADGKAVMGMKIFGAGQLSDRVDECLQFALANDFIDCFTIGQEDHNEFMDLTKRIPASSVRG
jgi:aryl-alcohol dehydrogenase-like predicted oxidoreductase